MRNRKIMDAAIRDTGMGIGQRIWERLASAGEGKMVFRGRCPWRRKRIAGLAGKTDVMRMRELLAAALLLELLAVSWREAAERGMNVRLVSREQDCRVEWVVPAGKDLLQGEETPEDVYGLRFRPETLEVQFYHRTEEFREGESRAEESRIEESREEESQTEGLRTEDFQTEAELRKRGIAE